MADLDKIYYVVEGTGRLTVGGATETLGPGELLVAPAGVEHGLDNGGPDPLLVLVVVAPPPAH
ncbi:MAG: cupin domain-containing protein [Candidatus Methylomirabilia bacterium]